MECRNYITVELSAVERIFAVLPDIYRKMYLMQLSEAERSGLTEIRLRADMPCSFTVFRNNIPMVYDGVLYKSNVREIQLVIERMCDGSVYSYSDCMGKGFIPFMGTRVGLAGISYGDDREKVDFGTVTSLNIRIPRSLPNAADEVVEYIRQRGLKDTMGVIAVSPPNCGKTTFLRALAARLSDVSVKNRGLCLRTCIADERNELFSAKMFENCLCDSMSGVPKLKGAEIAVRTMSAQLLVFDEIANEAEAEALKKSHFNGVYIAASVHASSVEDILNKRHMRELIESGVFKTAYVLHRYKNTVKGKITDLRENGDCR